MSRGLTGRGPCELPGCRQIIGRCGFAFVSHMRAHVRRGEATERLQNWKMGSRYTYKPTGKVPEHKYQRACDCPRCMATFNKRQRKKYGTV